MRILSAAWFTPDWAIVAMLAGSLLVYWEMARPGLYLPGACGGALLLVGLARMSECVWTVEGGALAVVGFGLVGLEVWLRWPGPPGLVGALMLAWAASRLRIQWYVALPAALVWSAVTVALGSAALRGWIAKRPL